MTNETEVTAAKKAMRTAAKTRRAAAFAAYGDARGAAIAAHGIGFAGAAPGAIVSGFASIGDEIDAMPLLARLHGEGYVLALPAMQGKGKPLVFRRWQPGDEMAEVMWGIKEPLPTADVLVPDVLLVPLLAFDRAGFRLGYGGGFYDRSLAEIRAVKQPVTVGLAYDELAVDAVPRLDYDERLDWVLTPSGPRRCMGS